MLEQHELTKRAELLLAEADKLGFRRFITAADVVNVSQPSVALLCKLFFFFVFL